MVRLDQDIRAEHAKQTRRGRPTAQPLVDTQEHVKDSDRRYTDQEVALVLQRAAEIEERKSSGALAARGLTLHELHEIAKEVGFSPAVIDEALTALQTRPRSRPGSLLGAPLSCKMIRAVPHHLGDEALRRLIRVIEDCVDVTGTVTDALGTVRWTSILGGHGLDRRTQVSLSSDNNETQIQVVQRYPAGLRAMLQFLPGVWGAAIGAAVAASLGVTAVGTIGVGVGAATVGLGIGRSIWQMLARRGERQVERIVSALVAAAGKITT